MHMRGDHAPQVRRRQLLLIVDHLGVSHQELQDAVIPRDRSCHHGVDVGDIWRQQASAEPEIDDTRRRSSNEYGFGVIGGEDGFSFVDRRNAAVLTNLADTALHYQQDEIVLVAQPGGVPGAHR